MGYMAVNDAWEDIMIYYDEIGLKNHEKHKDCYYVSKDRLFNKESRRLNKLLGINTLNYVGNTNHLNTKRDGGKWIKKAIETNI